MKEITANAPGDVKVWELASSRRGAGRHRAAPRKQSFAQQGGRWEEGHATPQDGIYSPSANQAALPGAPGWAGSRQRHNDQIQAHSKCSCSMQEPGRLSLGRTEIYEALMASKTSLGTQQQHAGVFNLAWSTELGACADFQQHKRQPWAPCHRLLLPTHSSHAPSPRSSRRGCTARRAGFH